MFDGTHLLLVGGNDLLERGTCADGEMIRAGTRIDHRTRDALGLGDGAADQLQRIGPVEPHPALGRVHGLGDSEAQVPEMAAEGERALPVDRHVEPGVLRGEVVVDHVRRGERDAVPVALLATREVLRSRELKKLEAAISLWKTDDAHPDRTSPSRRRTAAAACNRLVT